MGKNEKIFWLANLRELASVDIRTIGSGRTFVDMENVKIDPELPVQERVMDYIRQIKNPYCYRSHGVIVKISFAGTRKLEECLGDCVSV